MEHIRDIMERVGYGGFTFSKKEKKSFFNSDYVILFFFWSLSLFDVMFTLFSVVFFKYANEGNFLVDIFGFPVIIAFKIFIVTYLSYLFIEKSPLKFRKLILIFDFVLLFINILHISFLVNWLNTIIIV